MKMDFFTLLPGEKPLDNIKPTCGFAGILRR